MVAKFVYAEGTFTTTSESKTGGGSVVVEHDAFILPTTGVGLDLGAATWTVKIDGVIDSPDEPGLVFEANSSGVLGKSTLTVGTDATIRALDNASAAVQAGVVLDVTNAGLIQGGFAGISAVNFGTSSAKAFTITNAATGTISGDTGIQTSAPGQTLNVKNFGLIVGTAQDAIDMVGAANITNGGTLIGDIAQFSNTAATSITNLAGATINGDIGLGDVADTVKNAGSISGDVQLQGGKNSLTNNGSIGGGVSSGGGDDTVVNSGSIGNNLFLGEGANKATNSGSIGVSLIGGAGNDVVTNSGTIGNQLFLGDGANTVINSGVVNQISTGSGIDIVTNSGKILDVVGLGVAADKLTNSGTIGSIVTMDLGGDTVINSGTLGKGIDLGADADKLTNSGTITGTVQAGAGDDTIGNTKLINGTVALDIGDNKLTNSGTITGDVLSGTGHDTFTNTGIVSGNIALGGGGDTFTGGKNRETVLDGSGNDKYLLGGGNDVLTLQNGSDFADGGAGTDRVLLSGTNFNTLINLDTKAVTLPGQLLQANLVEAAGAGISTTIKNFEDATGGNKIDIIAGNAGANALSGLGDNDALYGGLGADTLTGGTGDDFFYYLSTKDSGNIRATRDTITDFTGAGVLGGDKIILKDIDADTSSAADDDFSFLSLPNTAFTQAGQLRVIFDNGDTIVQGDVNGDGKADFSIALTGILNLNSADFTL